MPGDAQWSILHALARVLEQQFSGGKPKALFPWLASELPLSERWREAEKKKKVLNGICLVKGRSGEPSIN